MRVVGGAQAIRVTEATSPVNSVDDDDTSELSLRRAPDLSMLTIAYLESLTLSSTPEKAVDLMSLPPELLVLVLAKLDAKSLFCAAHSCRTLCRLEQKHEELREGALRALDIETLTPYILEYFKLSDGLGTSEIIAAAKIRIAHWFSFPSSWFSLTCPCPCARMSGMNSSISAVASLMDRLGLTWRSQPTDKSRRRNWCWHRCGTMRFVRSLGRRGHIDIFGRTHGVPMHPGVLDSDTLLGSMCFIGYQAGSFVR